MINFIVCDDNSEVRQNVADTIGKWMMKNQLAYKVHLFSDYDKSFKKVLDEKLSCKIYILDIEAPSASGIDIARKIRDTDIDSIIIFLTSHNELGSVLLQDELMFLTFICKFNDQEKRLESAITKALQMVGVKQAIRFDDRGSIYTIPLNDILYVTRDSVDRKSMIVTDYTEYKIGKPLNEIMELLDQRFKQTHRACITNMDRVRVVDKRGNTILFDNGLRINLLSDNYKKGLRVG